MRKFTVLMAVLVAAALAPISVMAQTGVVTGTVTNAQTNEPIAAAQVSIRALNISARSGPEGDYRLVIPDARSVSGQSVQLTASRVGLTPITRRITLVPGANLTQNFRMVPRPRSP
jgi:hypothetical protein